MSIAGDRSRSLFLIQSIFKIATQNLNMWEVLERRMENFLGFLFEDCSSKCPEESQEAPSPPEASCVLVSWPKKGRLMWMLERKRISWEIPVSQASFHVLPNGTCNHFEESAQQGQDILQLPSCQTYSRFRFFFCHFHKILCTGPELLCLSHWLWVGLLFSWKHGPVSCFCDVF